MSELKQILQYEEQKKEEISKARQAAKEAIQKKQELKTKLVADDGLSVSEREKIIQQAKDQIKELEGFYKKQQKDKLDDLLRKKSTKFEKAVDCVVADFYALNI